MAGHILLVDDERPVLDAWKKILKPLKHEIIAAETEEQAVKASAEYPFDVVVIDYLIPPKTGLEIVTSIRKKLPFVRTILVSARFDQNLSQAQLKEMVREKVEVDEYLHKPVQPKVLRETVARLMAGKQLSWKERAGMAKSAREASEQEIKEHSEKLKKHLK